MMNDAIGRIQDLWRRFRSLLDHASHRIASEWRSGFYDRAAILAAAMFIFFIVGMVVKVLFFWGR